MENIQIPSIIKNKVVFAFPGMGKTPYCQTHAGCVDADFGFFRNAMNIKKVEEELLLKPWAKLCKYWVLDKYTVFVNEPKLLYHLDVNMCVMFLPRYFKYSAQKMETTEQQVAEWVSDWAKIAKDRHLGVGYIDQGLDTFLS